METTTTKAPRKRWTPADKLAEVDAAIEATQVRLARLIEKRAAIVDEARALAQSLLDQVK